MLATTVYLSFLAQFALGAIEPNGFQNKTFLYYGYTLGKLHSGSKLAINYPSDPTLVFTLPADTIVTLPEESTPNQQPFPHEIIPPQLATTPRTRDLPPPDAETFQPEIVLPLTLSPDTVSFPPFAVDPSPIPTIPLPSGLVARQPGSLAQNFPPTFPLPGAPAVPAPPAANPALTQCSCVVAGTCITRSLGGVVDVRVVTQNPGGSCPVGQQWCCSSSAPPAQPQQDSCGLPNVIPGVFPTAGQANLGEYPWSGIIYTLNNQYVAGATLITTTHLLAAAHTVITYGNGANLKIRLGEWDITGSYEPVTFAEYAVAGIAIHPQYTATTLQNDLAVITLATPSPILTAPTVQVNTACLPAATDVFTGMPCTVAGWGSSSWGGNYQNIIKKVDLTVVGGFDCQTRLRTTKLGPNWNLDPNSFICAGGEVSKDACTGDGGNALVCQVNGRSVIAGITAGGVECGHAGIPGLYVNVANYLEWIGQQAVVAAPAVPGTIDPRRGSFAPVKSPNQEN